MKKNLKLLIILLILIPFISVKAETKNCKYIRSSGDVKNAELTLEGTTGSFKITSGFVILSNDSNQRIGFIQTDTGAIKLSDDNNTYRTADCPSQIGLTNPISSGIGILKPNDCSGILEYGCLVLGSAAEQSEESPAMESTRYKEITTCRAVDYDYIKDCGCMPAALATLTSRLYMLIKIVAPALLLIIGGFDLIKAMSAQDDKAINKARQKLVRKFIAAAAVFLVFTFVQFLVENLDTGDTMKCFDYMLNDSYNP